MNRYASILNGGSLAGISAFIYFLILYAGIGTSWQVMDLGNPFLNELMTLYVHPFGAIKMLGVCIPIYFMYRSVKRFKAIECEGFIEFGRAFRIGVMFTFIYASLSAMLTFLFGTSIDASFVTYANEIDVRLFEMARNMGEEMPLGAVDEQIEALEQRDLAHFAASELWSKSISGFIIALIVAAIIKQKPPTFADDE